MTTSLSPDTFCTCCPNSSILLLGGFQSPRHPFFPLNSGPVGDTGTHASSADYWRRDVCQPFPSAHIPSSSPCLALLLRVVFVICFWVRPSGQGVSIIAVCVQAYTWLFNQSTSFSSKQLSEFLTPKHGLWGHPITSLLLYEYWVTSCRVHPCYKIPLDGAWILLWKIQMTAETHTAPLIPSIFASILSLLYKDKHLCPFSKWFLKGIYAVYEMPSLFTHLLGQLAIAYVTFWLKSSKKVSPP